MSIVNPQPVERIEDEYGDEQSDDDDIEVYQPGRGRTSQNGRVFSFQP